MAGKRIIAAGVGAGLLLGGVTGLAVTVPNLASAQDDATTTVPAEGARPKAGPFSGVLDGLVTNGTITQEQADAIVGAGEAARAERHANRAEGGMGRVEGGMGRVEGGMGRPEMRGPGRPGGPGRGGMPLENAAEAIGITVEELRTGLQSGQSLAVIAEANGVSADTLIEELTNDARTRITDMVNRTPGERPAADAPMEEGGA
jgi:hypothetical protein